MSDESEDDAIEGWQRRAENAEAALAEVQKSAAEKLLLAELKAEAIQAGMIDLDGLKLIDLSQAVEADDAGLVLAKLKRAKPWLFGQARSSSVAVHAPRPEPPRMRHANELSHEEWVQARAALLKRR